MGERSKQLKTITLCSDDDNPTVSILKGAHSAKVFNAAFMAEGWQSDPISQSELKFLWYVKERKGKKTIFTHVKHEELHIYPYARLYTVSSW